VRNDVRKHDDKQFYVLRAKELNTGTDVWPEIQLAQVVLEPNPLASPVEVALNAPAAVERVAPLAPFAEALEHPLPKGCVRDLDPARREHRRVIFRGAPEGWSIATQIMAPPPGTAADEALEWNKFQPDRSATIGDERPNDPTGLKVNGVPFKEYEADGTVDWEGTRSNRKHVCIDVDHVGSHKQLWVLVNRTGALHNFHIHQIKFRLATKKELADSYGVKPTEPAETCPGDTCEEPNYRLYEETDPDASEAERVWHDTIPVPVGKPVFLIMSFDAKEQMGRFVYHCHILKHEDKGLMAPIEVWSSRPESVFR
jgi:hypothetical protein